MRISHIILNKFRRFSHLEIRDIPETARLVVLAGPNGSGKSSLFDALLLRYRMDSNYGWNSDHRYYNRPDNPTGAIQNSVTVKCHSDASFKRGSLYVRSAYRHDPEFEASSLSRQGEILDGVNLARLIEHDATVKNNYQRLASQAMEDVFVNEAADTTIGAYRDKLIGECREPMNRLFPDLTFLGVGNPLAQGTFKFDKGSAKGFDYKNLSGGEKAAFDLVLDFIIKRKSYDDAIYCIDEPELHMNTKLQGALLEEVFNILPSKSQLWISTHSIGMMRKAREMYTADPSSVVFLDFGAHNFDQPAVMAPSRPTRAFWENVMHVALDDLAALVAPREAVICEGNPAGTIPGKNSEHDARVYETIFSNEFPDVNFISAGNAKEVAGDFFGLAAALPKIASGIKVTRLIDRDDHAAADIAAFNANGLQVLSRRHLEAYLYDDEVLAALCASVDKEDDLPAVLSAKQSAITNSIARGNPNDDIKSAAGHIYIETKRILGLNQVGNDQMAFARNTLAPLVGPNMVVYQQLKADIFGK